MTSQEAPRPAPSLAFRLIAGALVWVTVMLATGGGVLAFAFRQTVEGEFSHRLDAMLRSLVAVLETTPEGAVTLLRPLGEPRFAQVFSGWYWQVTPPSGPALRSRSLWDAAIPVTDGGASLQVHRTTGPNGETLLIAERDLEFPGIQGRFHVLVAGDLAEVRGGVHDFNLLLASALGILGLGLALAVLFQVRFGLKPLRQLAIDLRAVRDGARARLTGNYPQEVAPLAAAMNDVLDADAALIDRARTHVGNLAHGLKTPLAILATEANDQPVLKAQVSTMRRLIEHHLGRAASIAGAGRALGVKVPLRAEAEGLAGALSRIFAARALNFEIDIADGVAFRGHREDIEEILGNLMENACKWASSRVRVTAHEVDRGIVLAVEDDGPGMSQQQVVQASQRGRRLDEITPGWGLGLSIVADLVDVNGGTMTFSRSDLGGLSVHVRL